MHGTALVGLAVAEAEVFNRSGHPMFGRSTSKRHRPPTAGFTLVRVLIVVIVIGIVAALALPMLGQTHTTRLSAAARLLMADLAFAQTESITHPDDPCVVVFDQPANTYTVARASAPTTPITDPADDKPYVTQFGLGRAAELSAVTIGGYSLDGDDRIAFGPYGQLDQTTSASITLQSGAHTLTIQIDPVSGEAYLAGLRDAPSPVLRPARPAPHYRLRTRVASIWAPNSTPTPPSCRITSRELQLARPFRIGLPNHEPRTSVRAAYVIPAPA